MTPIADGPNLCETCREIDWAHLMQDPLPFRYAEPTDRPGTRVVRLVHSDDCDLCAILMPNHHPGDEAQMVSYVYSTVWTTPKVPQNSLNIALRLLQNPETNSLGSDALEDIILFDAHTKKAPPKMCPAPDTPSYDVAQAWLRGCQDRHSAACQHVSSDVEGMYLIDVDKKKIVKASDLASPKWIALSYVWGDPSQCSPLATTDTNQIRDDNVEREYLPNVLAKTVEDAITVTKNLNYRYLWVDELCIAQHDSAHRTSQINNMDQIYRGADLTLVAAAGNSKTYGLPGVSKTLRNTRSALRIPQGWISNIGPDPMRSIEYSSWFTRAWTLQEGYLSKRLLVFSDHQMAFVCRKTAWMESMCCQPEFKHRHRIFDAQSGAIWSRIWGTYSNTFEYERTTQPLGLTNFENLISNYTARSLSYASDALNAVAGSLHFLSQGQYPVLNIAGLPYYRCYSGARQLIPIEKAIGHATGWCTDVPQQERRETFPSWTWAGWTGPVMWPHYDPGKDRTYLRNVELRNDSNQAIAIPEEINDASRMLLQRALDTIKTIAFEAPTIPATFFSGDISNFRFSDHSSHHMPPEMRKHLSTNVQQGLWSCFVLSKQSSPKQVLHSEYTVLVCSWLKDSTAERVGCFLLTIFGMGEATKFMTSLGMRHVRIV